MKHSLVKNQILTLKTIEQHNPVIISWLGGSYGNFIYRLLHRYIVGFPELYDNFNFHNGSSHKIYKNQYINDFLLTNYKQSRWKIKYDIDFDYLCIKKHCHHRLPFRNTFSNLDLHTNIKINLHNKKYAVFSLLQNSLKLKNKSNDLLTKHKIDITDFLKNNLSECERIIANLHSLIGEIHNDWYIETNDINTVNISVKQILEANDLYNFLNAIKNKLQTEFKPEIKNYEFDYQVFIQNQIFYDSLQRSSTNVLVAENLVDVILNKF